MSKTIAAKLVEILEQAGVTHIHGVVGDSLNGITDELRKSGKIKWIHYRHEEAAAFAAGAEAQLTGKLAVCAGSCGPGNMHLINGLYDAHRSNASVLAIAAQVPSEQIGTSYFQETRPETLFRECSYYCETIASAKQMPRVLQIAIQTAVSLKGVSVVSLSGDVAMQAIDNDELEHPLFLNRPVTRPSDTDLNVLAKLISQAEKITLLCGAGCAGAHDELITLAGLLSSPTVHALRGKEYVQYDNPFDVGMTGLIGMASGNHAVKNCDLLLMLGTDFPYKEWYPDGAKIVQIDIRPERLGRRCKLNLGLTGDIGETIKALMPLVKAKTDTSFLKDCQARPQLLKLELTESLLLGDIEDTIVRMEQLKREGVGFALDDFGTGYSSLSYLKRLPLDQIKIDQSFVRDVLSDPNDAAIVRTILALAKSLDLQVVAEGVETTGQLGFLRLHGCEGFQGYLFGRPVPVEEIDAMLDPTR